MPEFNNLDLADRLTVLILADCLAVFPSPAVIDWRTIAKRLSVDLAIEGLEGISEDYFAQERTPFLCIHGPVKRLAVAGDTRDLRDVIHNMLLWLSSEGYIIYKPNFTVTVGANGDPMVSLLPHPASAVISGKALAIMRKTPDPLNGNRTLADVFKNAGANVGDKAMGEIASKLVSRLFLLMTGAS